MKEWKLCMHDERLGEQLVRSISSIGANILLRWDYGAELMQMLLES